MDELQDRKELNGRVKIPSILELIQITINRKQWSSRTPFQKWCYFYGIGKACLTPHGYSAYDNNLSMKFRSYFLTFCIFGYFAFVQYTVFYYTKHGEFAKCLPCTCLYCLGLSVCFHLSFIENCRKFLHGDNFISACAIYNHNDDRGS